MKMNETCAFRVFSLLSQVSLSRNEKQAIKDFIAGLIQVWGNTTFSYLTRLPKDQQHCIEISSHQEIFGYIHIDGFDRLSEEDRSLLDHAVAMFALILKNIQQEKLISDEKKHLQKLMNEHTGEVSESEERFRWMTDHAKDMIYRMSLLNGKYEYVSAASLELTGYAPEEFYANPTIFHKMLHPVWLEYFKKEWHELIRGNAAPTYEYQILHKSGEIRWLNQRNVLVKDSEGHPVAIEGIVTDITENKRRQEEINKAKEQLEEAQQLAKIGHWEWDMRSNTTEWSGQTYKNFGLDPQSVPVDYDLFKSFIVKEDRALENAESVKVISLEIPFYNLDLRIRRADGVPAIINAYGKLYFDEQGKPYRMAGTIQDITERKYAEELARENEIRFSAAFNSNEDAQILVSVDSDVRFVIAEVNSAFIRDVNALGFHVTREKCIGLDLNQIEASKFSSGPIRLDIILEHYRAVLKKKKGISFESAIESGKRKVYTYETITPIRGSDRTVRYIFHSSHNITQQKKADIELRDKQQFIESIVNLVPDVLYIYDLVEKKNVYSNEGVQTVLGYSVQEMKEMEDRLVQTIFHPEDFQIYLREILPQYASAGNGEFITYQCRMKHKSGRWKYVECKELIFLRSPGGAPRQIFGVVHDLTHIKDAEKALKKNEEKYRQLFTTMIDGYALHKIICDAKGKPKDYRFLDVNPAFERLTGLQKDAILGRTVLDVLPEIEPIWIEKYGEVALTGKSLSFSGYSSGLGKYYSINAFSPRKNHFAVVFVDVTEQKRAEEALREREQQLSIASRIARVGYWEFDVDKRMFTFNDHFYNIFQTNVEEIGSYQMSLEEYADKFLHPDDRYLVMEETKKALEATDPNYNSMLEHRVIFPDGEVGYINVYIFIQKDATGRTIKTYGANQDVTDHIKLENQIKKELREKEVLLREVHHRVKNNLNVITSLLGLQELQIKNRKQALEALEESRNRVYSMAMVHELLYRSGDFSRIDMKPYIEQMTYQLMFANMLKERIEVSIRVEEVYLGINSAIPCGLILNEMISNALKHAFKGREKGQLNISFNILKDKTCKLIIKDDGVGLPDNFDVKTSQTMGFQLMRILAQQLEGELIVKHGKGTTLVVKFPQES